MAIKFLLSQADFVAQSAEIWKLRALRLGQLLDLDLATPPEVFAWILQPFVVRSNILFTRYIRLTNLLFATIFIAGQTDAGDRHNGWCSCANIGTVK
jgi:hypothetical protein